MYIVNIGLVRKFHGSFLAGPTLNTRICFQTLLCVSSVKWRLFALHKLSTSHIKAGFHMIAGKNVRQSLRLCGNHFLAIVAITAIIWKPAYMETAQRSKSPRPLNFFGSDHMENKALDQQTA